MIYQTVSQNKIANKQVVKLRLFVTVAPDFTHLVYLRLGITLKKSIPPNGSTTEEQ
ncbi:MAG TPA: hypothetical protein V6C89_08720 [Drouetiella sp.]|jgi:hypothetical protein